MEGGQIVPEWGEAFPSRKSGQASAISLQILRISGAWAGSTFPGDAPWPS